MEQNLNIRIAIIEDEPEDADLLKNAIEHAQHDLSLSFTTFVFDNPTPFINKYKSNYDIIFLDIELPNINGLELAKQIREIDRSVIIIFVTNMAQFAVDGYKVDAMDFIVKPISYPNLKLKLERAFQRINNNQTDKLVVNDKTSTHILLINEIKYIEVINHKLIFHTINDAVSSIGSLSKLEEKLTRFSFSRCNNCYLINMKYVTKIENFDLFIGDTRLQISRSRKKQFLKDLADYLGGTI